MEGEDLSDSDDYIELPFTSPSIRQEELAPLSGSVLLQPQYPNGIQNQLLARIASARRQKPLKVYGLNSNGPTTLPSFLALGKADTVGDGWRTDSDSLSNGFAISSPPLFSERYHGAPLFPSPLATFDQATVVQTYLGFAAFIEPLPIDHIMIPEAMEEDILGEGVTFRVTESFLSFPLSRRSQNTRDLVALKRVKAPQYLLERAEKQSIEKVCFELRVLLHEQIRIHPNIVNIICIAWEMQGSDPYDQIPSPVLVMEHAAFGALNTYQSSNELSWVQKRRISLEVARGLEVLHDSGVIHGDIKSENVLLFPSNDHGFEAKLSDFGASLLDDDYESTVKIIGTRIWSAPETLSGPVLKEWAPAADVYSFGLLCFRICMDGKNPFWALPIFDLDPDLSSIEVLKQIQELKLRSDFVDMCLQYAVRDELAEFPLVKIIGTSLGQSPSQRNNVKSLVQDLQGFKVETLNLAQETAPQVSKRLSLFTPSFIGESPLDIVNCMVLEHNYRRQDKLLPYEVKRRIVTDLLQLSSSLQEHKCHHCCQKTMIDTEPDSLTFDMLVARRSERECTNLGESMEIVRACEAAFELSYCYADGFGTEISLPEALKWMRFAAENGLARAQAAIIPLYESAVQEIPTDMPSLTWLYNGMMKGSFEASSRLRTLYPTLHTLAREVYLRCERGIGRGFWIDQHPDKIWPVGDLQSLIEILSAEGFSKGHVRANDHYGDTLLHLTAATGYPETVLYLCREFEHPVNAQNNLGETALLAACRSGCLSTIQILLANGADSTIATVLNAVPLHWIMAFQSDEEATGVCELLLCSASTIEVRSKSQQLTYESCTPLWFCGTPLHWAVTARNIAAVKALLSHEASPTSQNSRNETPIQAAAALNFHAALRLMLPRCKDADLLSLCRIGTMEIPIFFHMLQFGASWKEKRIECITELLEHSARTMDAKFTNDLVSVILQAWPASLLDRFLDTVPLQSIFAEDVDLPIEPLVNLILQSQYSSFLGYMRIYDKVGPKAQDEAQKLLKAAASVNDPRFIQQLLKSRLSPYDEIDDGLDAFGVAVVTSALRTADAILESDNRRRLSIMTTELKSIEGGGMSNLICRILESNTGVRASSIFYLIERCPDAIPLTAVPEKKATVFHVLAAQFQSFHRPILTKDYRRAFRILLDHFKDDKLLNTLDIMGETALHYAVEAVNFEAVYLLLEAGADPNHRGEGVDTALGKAFKILEGFLLKNYSRFELPERSSKLGVEGKRISEKRLEEIIELLRDHEARTGSELKTPPNTLTPSLEKHIDPERLHRNDWDHYMQSQDETDITTAFANTAAWEERMRNLHLSSN